MVDFLSDAKEAQEGFPGRPVKNPGAAKEDRAVYSRGVRTIEVGPNGAWVWRRELLRTGEPNNLPVLFDIACTIHSDNIVE